MAKPDKIRNSSDFADIAEMVSADPTIKTITHAKSSTTMVRIAVATSESVFLIPHFARMDVIPAKKADRIAMISHINRSPFPGK